MKKRIVGIAMMAGIASLTLVGCQNGSESASSSGTEPTPLSDTAYYDALADRVAFDAANANNISESFADGKMSDAYWNTLSGVWQNDSAVYPHNGVQQRNLAYVSDGSKTYLGIKGRGIYDSSSDAVKKNGYTLPEGGCIISKNKLGPGRFEIEMAVMPREGGVTAMWTYNTTTGSEATSQNEIDIEVGGNTSKTYTQEWCTSWTTHTVKQTNNVDTSSKVFMNDGKMHKYTFDWYTNYGKTAEPRVDWFLDGMYLSSVKGDAVPTKDMPLWIGLWFANWCSKAAFDEDYLLIQSIKYTAFDSTQDYETTRSKSGYTQVTPSQAGIPTITYETVKNLNKISNGDFETLDLCKQDASYMGWVLETASKGTLALSTDKASGTNSLLLTSGTGTGTHGEYLEQTISNFFEGYEFDFAFAGKKATDSTKAEVVLHYTDTTGKEVGNQTLSLDSTSWKNYSYSGTMPKGSRNLLIELNVDDGAANFDAASLIYKGAQTKVPFIDE
jgi:hypothetical protein